MSIAINKYKHSNDSVVHIELFWWLNRNSLGYIANSEICHEIHHIAAGRLRGGGSRSTAYVVRCGIVGPNGCSSSPGGIPRGDRHEVRLRGSDSRLQTWPPPPSWPWTPTCWTIAMQPTSLLLRNAREKQPQNIIITSWNYRLDGQPWLRNLLGLMSTWI